MRPRPTSSARAQSGRRPPNAILPARSEARFSASERAFTLVEVVVTLVIFAIVMAMVMSVATNLMGAERKSISKKRASSSAQTALDQLSADIRSITSREAVKGGGQTDDALQFVTDPSSLAKLSVSARTPLVNEKVDLVAISPRSLTFFVANGQDAQCVRYDAETSGRILRTTFKDCAGLNPPLSQQVLLDPAPTSEQVAPFSFRYYAGTNCKPTALAAGLSTLDARTSDANGIARLNSISSITVDLRSHVIAGNVRGSTALKAEYTMRTRVTDSYLRELGGTGCVMS